MATPIKVTPVIRDQDSKRFNQVVESSQNKRVSPAERQEINTLVQRVLHKKSK